MDASKVLEQVTDQTNIFKKLFQLNNMYLDIVVDTINDEHTMANCQMWPDYLKAKLTFDPNKHETASELLDSVRHECLHLLLMEFDVFYSMVDTAIKDQITMDLLDRTFKLAIERSVTKLENIFDFGFKLTPERMLEVGKE